MDERGRELDALLVAERELLDAIARPLGQPEPLDPALGRPRRGGVVAPVQPREIDELVAHAHLRVQPALLRHVAEAPAHLEVDRRAAEQHLAAIGGQDAEDDAHRRRLARAVGADEAEHLALAHGERDAVEGDDVSVAAREVPQLEHCPVAISADFGGLVAAL